MRKKNGERYNIGLLVAAITDPFSGQLSQGVMAAAEKYDVNLCIIPGKYVGLDYGAKEADARYEYQYNALFSYAAAGKFDYLIVALGTIAYALDNSQKKELLKIFDGTPLLTVAAEVKGFDYLQYDNKSGIVQAVDYLAQEQGRKHICMMIGDLNNFECAERYDAYLYALDKNDLDYESRYVITSDISNYCKDQADKLIDQNPDVDAVICVNDMIASIVYEALRDRGKRIGRDVAVVGFDDLPLASKLEPPLSSVRADAFMLGERAMEKALNFLSGKEDNDHFLATSFIPRQSSYGRSGIFKSPDTIFDGTYDEIIASVSAYLFDSNILARLQREVEEFCGKVLDNLINRFINKPASEDDLRCIMDLTESFFSRGHKIVDKIIKIHNVIDSGYKWVLERCPDESRIYATRLYEYLYKRINMVVVSDYKLLEDKQSQYVHMSNLVIRDTLMFDGNLTDYYAQILKSLHHIGSDTGYLYLFEKPFKYHDGEVLPRDMDWLFKSYHYGANIYTVPENLQRIKADRVFSNDYLAWDRRHTTVAADLYVGEYQYGMLLCEPRNADFMNELELITYQISAAVRTIEILREQERILTTLHAKNLALENISKIDELTKIYNRRGFYEAASKMIEKPENKGRTSIVCYADMDNLKMVNDGYGHIEGDFAIKSLAECLCKIFGSQAVVGRMGGDEYAAVVFKDLVGTTEEIYAAKDRCIEELNSSAEKPYRISLSIGLYECVCDDSYDLKAAMDKADDELYKGKSIRKKEI
ncbi:MAG: GGDEF domain-containing protein [Ruminococcus sp.]|nr:GGDEF domain-containing protein [Ruminococcus sp.]